MISSAHINIIRLSFGCEPTQEHLKRLQSAAMHEASARFSKSQQDYTATLEEYERNMERWKRDHDAWQAAVINAAALKRIPPPEPRPFASPSPPIMETLEQAWNRKMADMEVGVAISA